jgi:hypothetical protein
MQINRPNFSLRSSSKSERRHQMKMPAQRRRDRGDDSPTKTGDPAKVKKSKNFNSKKNNKAGPKKTKKLNLP